MGNSDVTMVALKDHPGYGYSGTASLLIVRAGDTFTCTPARAERVIAKGLGAKVVAVSVEIVPPVASGDEEADVQEPVKLDGRTKAGKAAKGK